jgi:hypothetical protein
MGKKLVLVLLLATMLAGGAFAQVSMSAGGGGTFSANFMTVTWTADGQELLGSAAKDANNVNITGGGFFGYFDITYVMLSLGMGFYDIQPKITTSNVKMNLTTFDIGVLGKYPFAVGNGFFFPALGIDVKIAVAQDTIIGGTRYAYGSEEAGKPDGSLSDAWTSLWFKFGIGGDIPLGDRLYIRPMFLYGFGTIPKTTQKWMDELNKDKKLADMVYSGLDLKLAIGFKF